MSTPSVSARKKHKRDPENAVKISMKVQGREFHAEGTKEEVQAKLEAFMADIFAPIRHAIKKFGEV